MDAGFHLSQLSVFLRCCVLFLFGAFSYSIVSEESIPGICMICQVFDFLVFLDSQQHNNLHSMQ